MSKSVNTYIFDPSRFWICTVSICTRSPGFSANGRGIFRRNLAHLLRRLSIPYLRRVRLTVLKLTGTSNEACTTSEHLRNSLRLAMIAATVSFGIERGECFGRELLVGITFLPSLGAFRTQRMTAVW